MRAIKQDDVIDVIYDSWHGLLLDEADKVVYDYAHKKLIPIEWVKRWAMKSENTYNREQIVEMLNDWEKENEIN